MRVLVLHDAAPRPGTGGAADRLLRLIRALRSLGCYVTLAVRASPTAEEYSAVLEEMRAEVDAFWAGDRAWAENADRPSHLSWNETLLKDEGPFDLSFVTLWFWNLISVAEAYLPLLRQHRPETRVICISDDCHGLRLERASSTMGRFSDQEAARNLQEREIAVLQRCDAVITVAEPDAAYLCQRLTVDVQTVGYAVNLQPAEVPFSKRRGVLFFGDFANQATLDAAAWIAQRVWPQVLEHLPGCLLSIAGNGSQTADLSTTLAITRLGPVPDIQETFGQARLFLSPVLYGTGVPTKNLAALATGTPLVTTRFGAAPLGLVHGKHALIADDPSEQASQVASLYGNTELLQHLRRNGIALAQSQHGEATATKSLASLMARVSAKPLSAEREAASDSEHTMRPHETLTDYLTRRTLTARLFLRQREPEQSLQHFRFAIAFVEANAPGSSVHRMLLHSAHEAYRMLGDLPRAERTLAEIARVTSPTRPCELN